MDIYIQIPKSLRNSFYIGYQDINHKNKKIIHKIDINRILSDVTRYLHELGYINWIYDKEHNISNISKIDKTSRPYEKILYYYYDIKKDVENIAENVKAVVSYLDNGFLYDILRDIYEINNTIHLFCLFEDSVKCYSSVSELEYLYISGSLYIDFTLIPKDCLDIIDIIVENLKKVYKINYKLKEKYENYVVTFVDGKLIKPKKSINLDKYEKILLYDIPDIYKDYVKIEKELINILKSKNLRFKVEKETNFFDKLFEYYRILDYNFPNIIEKGLIPTTNKFHNEFDEKLYKIYFEGFENIKYVSLGYNPEVFYIFKEYNIKDIDNKLQNLKQKLNELNTEYNTIINKINHTINSLEYIPTIKESRNLLKNAKNDNNCIAILEQNIEKIYHYKEYLKDISKNIELDFETINRIFLESSNFKEFKKKIIEWKFGKDLEHELNKLSDRIEQIKNEIEQLNKLKELYNSIEELYIEHKELIDKYIIYKNKIMCKMKLLNEKDEHSNKKNVIFSEDIVNDILKVINELNNKYQHVCGNKHILIFTSKDLKEKVEDLIFEFRHIKVYENVYDEGVLVILLTNSTSSEYLFKNGKDTYFKLSDKFNVKSVFLEKGMYVIKRKPISDPYSRNIFKIIRFMESH